MKFCPFFLLLVLAATASSQSDIDWCTVRKELCGNNPHIACMPNGFNTSSPVSNVRLIKLSAVQKKSLVVAHNKYRNQVAAGAYANISFPSASKMSEMHWDNSLQYLAEIHASYGLMKHDSCRATPDYPYSGQNLYQWMSSANNVNVDSVLTGATSAWFNEIKEANPQLVDKFSMEHLNAAGHFSVMVNDNNNRLGCGASTFHYLNNGKRWYGILVTCNYEYTNMLGAPTYVKGTPTRNCKTSKNYPRLCVS